MEEGKVMVGGIPLDPCSCESCRRVGADEALAEIAKRDARIAELEVASWSSVVARNAADATRLRSACGRGWRTWTSEDQGALERCAILDPGQRPLGGDGSVELPRWDAVRKVPLSGPPLSLSLTVEEARLALFAVDKASNNRDESALLQWVSKKLRDFLISVGDPGKQSVPPGVDRGDGVKVWPGVDRG
jgi:hypothetical protein